MDKNISYLTMFPLDHEIWARLPDTLMVVKVVLPVAGLVSFRGI
jgi:hypothetical protein